MGKGGFLGGYRIVQEKGRFMMGVGGCSVRSCTAEAPIAVFFTELFPCKIITQEAMPMLRNL